MRLILTAQGRLRCRRPVAQSAMRPDLIVMPTPHLDQHLCPLQSVEDFPVQKLVSQLTVEALDVSVLPWTTWFDEQGLNIQPMKPLSKYLGYELRAIIRPYMGWHPMLEHQPSHDTDHILRCQPAGNSLMDLPWEMKISASRRKLMICSSVKRFLAMIAPFE
jgi:hypothetical protein